MVVNVVTLIVLCEHIRPMRLEGLSRHSHPVCIEEPPGSAGDIVLCGLERNLTRQTMDVLMTNMDDLPMCLHCHITGVLQPSVQLLNRVATIILCYRYVHRDAPVDNYILFMLHSFEAR